MSIVATFNKQPSETQDYDIDFSDYLSALADTAALHVVNVPDGITLVSSSMNAGVVKVWLSGGEDRQKYKVTVRVTTDGGRIKEADFVVRVKEI